MNALGCEWPADCRLDTLALHMAQMDPGLGGIYELDDCSRYFLSADSGSHGTPCSIICLVGFM